MRLWSSLSSVGVNVKRICRFKKDETIWGDKQEGASPGLSNPKMALMLKLSELEVPILLCCLWFVSCSQVSAFGQG